jgi:DNA-binding MarR family transcriptional regulator
MAMSGQIGDAEYRRLLEFRTGLRRFLRWSQDQATAVGLTPTQHQLLLAIRGHEDLRGPTIGEAAGHLLLRHHSTVELVDRAVAAGLVERARDPDDERVVRLLLTPASVARLELLTHLHLEELLRLAPIMQAVSRDLEET